MPLEHGKKTSTKRFLLLTAIVTISLPSLFLAGFYFAFYFKSPCHDLEKRVQKIEKYEEVSESILLEVTRSINDMKRRYLRFQKGELSEGNRREKRDASVSKNGDDTKEYEFRQEISILNERLSRMLMYNGDNGVVNGGKPGPPGLPGMPGPPGRNGRDGYHGMRGERGRTGVMGPRGLSGSQGKDGLPGSNGIPGLPGYVGPKGHKGTNGSPGRTGANGLTGQMGMTGQTGRTGARGQKGEPGECNCPTPMEGVPYERESDKVKPEVTFTMWGSATCPYTTRILYSGQLSMSKFVRKNGEVVGSNAICVPSHHGLRRSKRDVNKNKESVLPGMPPHVEDFVSGALLKNDMTLGNFTSYANNDSYTNVNSSKEAGSSKKRYIPDYAKLVGTKNYVPCAICHGERKISMLMVPSKNKCPMDWKIEYAGYLMSYHHGTSQSQIICVNDQALGVSPNSDPRIREILSEYVAPITKDCNSYPCRGLIKCALCTKSIMF